MKKSELSFTDLSDNNIEFLMEENMERKGSFYSHNLARSTMYTVNNDLIPTQLGNTVLTDEVIL